MRPIFGPIAVVGIVVPYWLVTEAGRYGLFAAMLAVNIVAIALLRINRRHRQLPRF
jgi:hypothetical protein